MARVVTAVSLLALACTPSSSPTSSTPGATPASSRAVGPSPSAASTDAVVSPLRDASPPSQIDPDGDDDPPEAPYTLPKKGRRGRSDGRTWSEVALPAEAGRPTDIARFKGALVALTEQGLWRIDVVPPVELGRVREKTSPFAITDAFCTAPIAVFGGALYAGSQRDGSLWRAAEGPAP